MNKLQLQTQHELCINHVASTKSYIKGGLYFFAQLESSADAIHWAIFNPAVAMAAEVHCQRPPAEAQSLHICTMPIV